MKVNKKENNSSDVNTFYYSFLCGGNFNMRLLAPRQFVTLPLKVGSSVSSPVSQFSNVVNSMNHFMILRFRYVVNSSYPIISTKYLVKTYA